MALRWRIGDLGCMTEFEPAAEATHPSRAYAEAWVNGDLATMIDLYASDVVVHYGGRSPFTGTHVGSS